MKVACIQQQAQGVDEYESVYANLIALTKEAIRGGADLVVQPETAYPAYFLGIDMEMQEAALARAEAFLAEVAALARDNGVHIVAGAAVRENGKIYNVGIMYDDKGVELGRARKSNMWHFDSHWFEPGTEYKAFDTKFGRMGLMVCADGRVPEIARILKLDGAKVIVDPVNLAAAAADPKMLMNQQYAFILPVRAMENGVWLLVADKVGLEKKTVSYLGRSMVIDPKGSIVADASTDKQEILYHDVDVDAAAPLPVARRPELYGELTKDNGDLPVTAELAGGVKNMADSEVFVSAAQFTAADAAGYLAKAAELCHAASFLGTRLVCLPPMPAGAGLAETIKKLQPLLKNKLLVSATGDANGVTGMAVFDADRIYGTVRRTHGAGKLSNGAIAVIDTPVGKIGGVFDQEPYVSEVPRVNMLLGCDILVWADTELRPMNTKVMQTRAAENKIFVVRVNNRVEGDVASVVNPDGAVMTSTFTGVEQAASAMVFRPLAKAKSVVPGTNVVLGRLGRTYGALTK